MELRTYTNEEHTQRRRKKLQKRLLYIIASYILLGILSYIPNLLELANLPVIRIAGLASIGISFQILLYFLFEYKSTLSVQLIKAVYIGQFVIWLCLYTFWVFWLNEMRIMALILTPIALIYFHTNVNYLFSLIISLIVSIVYFSISVYQIQLADQPGSIASEFFFIFLFTIVAFYISFTGRIYALQRTRLRNAKERSEQAREQTKIALKEAQTKEREIAHINQVVLAVNSTLDLDEVMKSIMLALNDIFNFNQISIFLINHDKHTLELSYWFGDGENLEIRKKFENFPLSLEWKEVYFVKTVLKRKTYLVSPITPELLELYAKRDRKMFNWNPHKSILMSPLEVHENIIGIINFVHTQTPFHLNKGEINQIQQYVSQIATSINNANLHKRLENAKNMAEELVEKRTKELRKAKEAAEVANRAKSVFLMNMSHELRTPLNGILTGSELITMSDTQEELSEIQQIIQSSSQALLQTIETILDFSKSQDGNLELEEQPFKLSEVLNSLKTRFFYKGVYIPLKLNFDIKNSDIPNSLIGDEAHLIEIFNHLLENAAKFNINPPKAKLFVDLTGKTADKVTLQLSLKDNGIGIEQEHFEKIFDPFSQVDTSSTRQYDGAGVGLSFCKQLVEMMGGKITLESELGKGSTFSFLIDLKIADSDEMLSIQLLENSTEKN